ncbi:formiminotetrahydrofolate cyclodeaminase [Clostridiales Family XIII bacterium PM5-7]
MKLIDMNVNQYLDVLKSSAPAPGGGSVSALAGAQGVALFMMVADLTIGKEKFAEFEEVCLAAKEKGIALYDELVASVDKDTEAFNLVAAAFKMPKETEDDKAARRQAIAHGTLVSTEVPFRTMELGSEGLKLAETMIGKSNPNAASDLGVAILNLTACIKGAWLNVLINLPGVKDEAKAKAFAEEGQKMFDAADRVASSLYNQVAELL